MVLLDNCIGERNRRVITQLYDIHHRAAHTARFCGDVQRITRYSLINIPRCFALNDQINTLAGG